MTPKLIKHTFEKCKIYLKKNQQKNEIKSSISYQEKALKYLKDEFI